MEAKLDDHGRKLPATRVNYSDNNRNMPALLPTPVYNNSPTTSTSRALIPIRRLTSAQMDERRSKGLCFNCYENFYREHVCKTKLFVLLMSDDGDTTPCEEGFIMDDHSPTEVTSLDTPKISIHAMAGQLSP